MLSTTATMTPSEIRLRLLENGYTQLVAVEGKIPRGAEWQLHETTPELVREWERIFPRAIGTGLVCVKVTGFDIDLLHKEAADAADQLTRELFPNARLLVRYGKEPKRLFLFRAEQPFSKFAVTLFAPESSGLEIRNGRQKGGPRLEVLGQGSQFVAFGPHEETKQDYRWPDGSPLDVRIEDLPEISEGGAQELMAHLVDMLREKFGYELASGHVGERAETNEDNSPRLLSQEDRFAQTEYGGTFGINQLILELPMREHDQGTPCEEVIKELRERVREAWTKLPDDHPEKQNWNWDAQHRQIDDSVYGDIKRRCGDHPSLVEMLPNAFLEAWREIEKRGGKPALYKKRGMGRGAWGVHDTGPAEEIPTVEVPRAAPEAASKKSSQKIQAIPFKAINEADLPAREFLFAKHYQRGQCTCSVGQDGAGKSTVSIAEAICMATARPILGEQPKARFRVWLHNADDDSIEMHRRIIAFCKHHEIPQTELEGWLFVTGKDNFKIKVVGGNHGGSIPDNSTVAAIVKTIRENEIDVAIFDPLIHFHTIIENSSTQLAEVAEQFADIASFCDCATDVVHHVRKLMNGTNEKEFTSEDSRGSGALRAAVRALRVYNKMSTTEAENASVAPDMKGFYLRVDRGKANYLPPAAKSTWFHLASVTLDNGDDVGTIEPWTYPGQGDGSPMEKRAEDMFMFLLLRQKHVGRPVSPAHNAQDYAPKVFARSKEARDAKIGVRHFKEAMERLLDASRIQIEDLRDGHRNARRVIVAVDLRQPGDGDEIEI